MLGLLVFKKQVEYRHDDAEGDGPKPAVYGKTAQEAVDKEHHGPVHEEQEKPEREYGDREGKEEEHRADQKIGNPQKEGYDDGVEIAIYGDAWQNSCGQVNQQAVDKQGDEQAHRFVFYVKTPCRLHRFVPFCRGRRFVLGCPLFVFSLNT